MGLRPTLEWGKMHALIGNGGFIYYAAIDFVLNNVTMTKMHEILPERLSDTNSVIHFMGSGVQIQDGLNLYQSYTATASSNYFNTVPQTAVGFRTGLLLPTIRPQPSTTCYTLPTNTLSAFPLLDRPNADITTQSFTFGPCVLNNCSITTNISFK